MTAGEHDTKPGEEGSFQIKIDERKLLWGLVLVLIVAGAVGAVQLSRQGDRIEELEDTVAELQQRKGSARGQQQRVVIPGGLAPVSSGAGAGASGQFSGDGTGPFPDETRFVQRKELIDGRLLSFQQQKRLDDETTEQLQTVIDTNFTNMQAIRQRVRDGELDTEQRRAAFQEEAARRDAELDALLGKPLARQCRTDVYQDRPRSQAPVN